MKKRYTVSVAGYEMNVLSDNTPEEIEDIVAALDRNIRTLCARSRSLPRNEAILLSALDAMAEKQRFASLAKQYEKEAEKQKQRADMLAAYIERRAPGRTREILGEADIEGEKGERD